MIRISEPFLGEEERKHLLEVLDQQFITNGPKVKQFEKDFANYIGVKHAIACNSGTAALHIALWAAGVKPEHEVITTPFSFISSANAITYCGAKPIFADIDEKTYNIDPQNIREKITEKTKAILPVHLYGLSCEMDQIMEIAKEKDLIIVEDAAQAHGATFKEKKVGCFGVGCFSFYPTKNITTGEGGMITTDNEEIAEKCRIMRNQGQEKAYFHPYFGYNYRMTDFQGAVGLAQLPKLDKFNKERKNNADYYDKELNESFVKPYAPTHSKHVYHQYTIRSTKRDELFEALKAEEIETGIFYPYTIPQQPIYNSKESFPVSEKMAKEVISIPVHPKLRHEDLQKVASILNSFS